MIPDMPARDLLMTTATGQPIEGFAASGDEALSWWQRLREEYPQTGLWPLLMEQTTPSELTKHRYGYRTAEQEAVSVLDGAVLLASRGEDRLSIYGTDLAQEIQAELRGEGVWREQGDPPGFGLATESGPVTVALVPVVSPWQVPLALHYGGWNEYPTPSEHAAILRYFHTSYGAELVAITATTAEFAVGRPPANRLDAVQLAWEYRNYNDGEYDLYFADTLTDLAASLLGTTVWRAWWD